MDNDKRLRVYISKGKVFRNVRNIEESKKIIDIIQLKGLMGEDIVDTRVYSDSDGILEHKFLKYIIHSGEYTESMAYDVTEKALDMAIDFVKHSVYSYDLLPHNFTYTNGGWLLYDFGAFELTSDNVKTQIRSTFKISFSAFELLKILRRRELRNYFLNRIKIEELFKMIPFGSFFSLTVKLFICKTLDNCKQYELSYRLLKYFFNQYKRKHIRHVYSFALSENLDNISKITDELLEENNIKDMFCIGEDAAKCVLSSSLNKNVKKFLYIDDYDICDEIYNYIYINKMKDVSTAVIYPFKDDNIIPEHYKYRGLYDSFARERFLSDAVMILEGRKFYKGIDIKDFICAVSGFAKKLLIIKVNKKDKNINRIKSVLLDLFKHISMIDCREDILILAKDKNISDIENEFNYIYENANRIAYAKLHSEKIAEILKYNHSIASI